MAVLVKPLEEGKKEQQQKQRPLSANALKGNGQFCMHVACFSFGSCVSPHPFITDHTI